VRPELVAVGVDERGGPPTQPDPLQGAACSAGQISIETAQSGLTCAVLAELAVAGKTIILGVLGLNDATVETAAVKPLGLSCDVVALLLAGRICQAAAEEAAGAAYPRRASPEPAGRRSRREPPT
jgi:hypothetical protein